MFCVNEVANFKMAAKMASTPFPIAYQGS